MLFRSTDFSDKRQRRFKDRTDAGKKLAQQLVKYKNANPFILSLPRGGVPVGYEIAKVLDAPLDVIIARKIGAPFNPELGIGAISEEGIFFLDKEIIEQFKISHEMILSIKKEEAEEMQRRVGKYRNGQRLPSLHNHTVILVDDGLATGVTAKAAVETIRSHSPKSLVFAVPVCSQEAAFLLRQEVDDFICLSFPDNLRAINLYYINFTQVSDEQVVDLLQKASDEKNISKTATSNV